MAIFSWLWARVYDKFMQDAETRCLQEWRSALLSNLSGVVLEIGCGTGLNLDYYPKTLDRLILLEPDANMRKKLQEKIALKNTSTIEILNCGAESIPLADASCDVVVSTLVLCSVANQKKVLAEIHRVLRPNGKLIFIEHVVATNNPVRLKWQQRLEPIWKIVTCGCHLTRPTEEAIIKAGFSFEEITKQSMRGVPPIVRPSIKGIAIKT